MRLNIRHVTTYTYDRPVVATAQLVRMTPRHDAGQEIASWSVAVRVGYSRVGHGTRHRNEEPIPVQTFEIGDGVGNTVHFVSCARPHHLIEIVAEGVVSVRHPEIIPIPRNALGVEYWLEQTPLTEVGDHVRQFLSSERLDGLDVCADTDPVATFNHVMHRVRDRIAFQVGATNVLTTADEALAQGAGVCQDHAHVLIAVARQLGVPARYVSGYFWPGDGAHTQASHAWAELYLAEHGWVAYDPANATQPDDAYVRVAIGRDYVDASPVRGVRRAGKVREHLGVSLEVNQVGALAPSFAMPHRESTLSGPWTHRQ